MFKQVFDPIAHSLGYSAIFALLPLLVIFVLLGGLRLRPFYAGLGALVTASLVAALGSLGSPGQPGTFILCPARFQHATGQEHRRQGAQGGRLMPHPTMPPP